MRLLILFSETSVPKTENVVPCLGNVLVASGNPENLIPYLRGQNFESIIVIGKTLDDLPEQLVYTMQTALASSRGSLMLATGDDLFKYFGV